MSRIQLLVPVTDPSNRDAGLQENGDAGDRVPRVFPALEVDHRAPRDVSGKREARADRQARHDEAREKDEREDAHGPGEADDGDELLEDDGKYDAAARAPAIKTGRPSARRRQLATVRPPPRTSLQPAPRLP